MSSHDALNSICETATELAFKQLEQFGEFIPFAVVCLQDGSTGFVALATDQVQPRADLNLETLRNVLRNGAQQQAYQAVAVASDVQIQMEDDAVSHAVCLEVEHVEETPVRYVLPYDKSEGELKQTCATIVADGENIVFGQ
ncbi:MAG: hypothetical protein R3C18_13320 [Planctomycetaceae bacterium]